jgi:adenylate cyclase
MTLRRKTLLIVGATLLALLVVLSAVSFVTLHNSALRVEARATSQNVERARHALDADFARLESIAGDWGSWDDAYQFVTDKNQKFIDTNIVDSTFTLLHLNALVYFNAGQTIIYGSGFDLNAGKAMPVPAGLMQQLLSDSFLIRQSYTGTPVTGLMMLPEGPLMIATQPVLTSQGEGPSRGGIVMGRYLDQAELATLSTQTAVSITIQPLSAGQFLPADFAQAQARLAAPNAPADYVLPLDDSRVAGYTLINDIHDQPALLLRIDTARDLYQHSMNDLSYVLGALLLIGLIFSVVTLWLLEHMVLARLHKLTASVRYVGSEADTSARVPDMGRDELGTLAGTINRTLAALAACRRVPTVRQAEV